MIRNIYEGHKLEPGDLLAHRTSSEKNYVLRKISRGNGEYKLHDLIILFASSLEELELFSESAGVKEILLADFEITLGTMRSGYVIRYVSD